MDPFLIEKVSGRPAPGQERTPKKRLEAFHSQLLEGYIEIMSGERNVLFKMKEMWAHLIRFDPGWEPYIKKLRKAQRLSEYRIITDQMFRE